MLSEAPSLAYDDPPGLDVPCLSIKRAMTTTSFVICGINLKHDQPQLSVIAGRRYHSDRSTVALEHIPKPDAYPPDRHLPYNMYSRWYCILVECDIFMEPVHRCRKQCGLRDRGEERERKCGSNI